MATVQMNGVYFSYDANDPFVLEDIDFTSNEGEFICILGQSGCGKSTLLRLLAGLEKPNRGEILVDGEKVEAPGLDRGVVFQDYGLFPWMSAGQNLMLALKQRYPDRDKKALKTLALSALEEVGLEKDVFSKWPKELSGGMQQRTAIAQAFSMDPPILLMDEPFGALDAVTRVRLQELVLALWSRREPKKTVFFVTHDVDEALLLASRIFVLGQSPSHIIYQCKLPEKTSTDRRNIFEDRELLDLRNELIQTIHRDVLSNMKTT